MLTIQPALDDIIHMTLQTGGTWAISHAKRLIDLAQKIGDNLPYDPIIFEYAAYLHDWGAFPPYMQMGVEHALRSRQVVEIEILPKMDLLASSRQILLEAIELHDYRDMRPTQSYEALLLREADMLEFLGMMGMAREFARGPKDIRVCYRRILERRNGIQGRFNLPHAREIARVRLERMDQCLSWLESESFGIL